MPTGPASTVHENNDRRFSPGNVRVIREWMGEQLPDPAVYLPRSTRTAIGSLGQRDPEIAQSGLLYLGALIPAIEIPTVEMLDRLICGVRNLASQYPFPERWLHLTCAFPQLGSDQAGKLTCDIVLGLAALTLNVDAWRAANVPIEPHVAVLKLAEKLSQAEFCDLIRDAGKLIGHNRTEAAMWMIADAAIVEGKLAPTTILQAEALVRHSCIPRDLRDELVHDDVPFFRLTFERKVEVVTAIEKSVTCKGAERSGTRDEIAKALSVRSDCLEPFPALIHAVSKNDPRDLSELLRSMSDGEARAVLEQRVAWSLRYKVPLRCLPSNPELLSTRKPLKKAATRIFLDVARRLSTTPAADFEVAEAISTWCLTYPVFRTTFLAPPKDR